MSKRAGRACISAPLLLLARTKEFIYIELRPIVRKNNEHLR